MTEELELAKASVRQAGNIIADNLHRVKKVNFKGRDSLVSNVDLEAEKAIVDRIKEIFPKDGIFAEEGSKDDLKGERTWVIDSLDGTGNYLSMVGPFCAGVALCKGGQPMVSAIYSPLSDELFWAAAGEGAFLNGERVRVSTFKDFSESVVMTDLSSRDKLEERVVGRLVKVINQAKRVRMFGSVLSSLIWVAAGRFGLYYRAGTFPWDVAAGALLVREAGGTVLDCQGEEWKIDSGSIVAGNERVCQQIVNILR